MRVPEHLSRRCILILAAAAALAGSTGCSYQSAYVPPNDGRARLVWTGHEVAEQLPPMDGACAANVRLVGSQPWDVAAEALQPWWDAPPDPDAEPSVGVYVNGGGGFVSGGHSGGGHAHGAPAGSHVGAPSGGTSGGGHSGGGGGSSGGGHGGGGGGGGGGDWGKGAIALLVLAYVAVPIVSAVWAADRPESTKVASSMDRVHAYNDVVRSGACGAAP